MALIERRVGRYRIIDKIGLGGGGEVYLARDVSLDRQVALKFLFGESAEDRTARRRFMAEAKATAAIDHPYVCKVYEVGEDEGRLFICMEYVEGQTLREALAAGALLVEQRLQITLEICEALAAAHAKGILHRDLKPANIMLTPDGHAKVLDFGIAKRLPGSELITSQDRGMTKTGMVLGTPAYMSPEQTENSELDCRSDIFSFGIIVYEMFAGVHPFRKGVPIKTMMAIIGEAAEPITHHWPECPVPLQRVVDRMLDKDPSQRYQTVAELRQDLIGLSGIPSRGMTGVQATASLPTAVRSIAVLPFVNMSSIEENEYFSDGITEEIILQLSKIRGLKVVSRTSTLPFKGSDLDLGTIGNKLAVDSLVEGSVRWAGKRVRISSKLIDTKAQTQIWAEAFNREVEDVFGIQEEVAEHIAAALEKSLSLENREQPRAPSGPQSFQAYQSYLRGRYYLNKATFEDIKKAIAQFQRSLDEDPVYARAYAGLSTCWAHAGHMGYLPIPESYPKARAAATKALELDDSLAEAHASMALIKLFHDWDLEGAHAEISRTLELNPNYAEAHLQYSWYAAANGLMDEAIAKARHAVELDPLSPIASLNLGWVLTHAEHYEEAIEQLNKTVELTPSFVPARLCLAMALLLNGQLEEGFRLSEECAWTQAQIAQAHAAVGQHEQSLAILRMIMAEGTADTETAYDLGIAYLLLGEVHEGLEWLEKAYQEHDAKLLYLKYLPQLKNLRNNPEFLAFVQKIGKKV